MYPLVPTIHLLAARSLVLLYDRANPRNSTHNTRLMAPIPHRDMWPRLLVLFGALLREVGLRTFYVSRVQLQRNMEAEGWGKSLAAGRPRHNKGITPCFFVGSGRCQESERP